LRTERGVTISVHRELKREIDQRVAVYLTSSKRV
jgi:hypothetical protein